MTRALLPPRGRGPATRAGARSSSSRRGPTLALWSLIAAAGLVGACRTGATSESAAAPAPSLERTHEAPKPAPAPPPTEPPSPEAPALSPPAPGEPAAAPACAEVQIGLSLRVLPHPPSDDSIRLYVLGQADDLRRSAPEGAVKDIRYQPGVGGMSALFTGATEAEALARCTEAVDRYLPTAPRLRGTMGPAARVLTPCRRCEAP